jgi:hypothetical protein
MPSAKRRTPTPRRGRQVEPAGPTLDELLRKTVACLDRWNISYLLIGGLAVGVVGEARMTHDVDLIIAVPLAELATFAQRAQAAGFSIARAALQEAPVTGALRLAWRGLHVDVIFASTEFEARAFARKRLVRLAGRPTPVPSPEDLVLLKLVPGRPKDLFDVEAILLRHRGKLDVAYLEQWAQRLSDEMEDTRIWETLQRLLKETDARVV